MTKASKVRYLDAIRGLAAVQVAIYHGVVGHQESLGLEFKTYLQSTVIFRILATGYSEQAVYMLFILSGRVAVL